MAGRETRSRRIAAGGLFAALSLMMMFAAALLPIATYVAPIAAGMMLLPVAIELGVPTALVSYAAVSLLSLFTVPDVEATAMFLAFFGYYPLLRSRLQRLPAAVRVVCNFALFNASVCGVYAVLIFVFSMQALAQELSGGYGLLLLALGNVMFWAYDRMIGRVLPAYLVRLRPRIIGTMRR